jgi:nucleoside-diphosphate-sugar epimerase
MTAQAPGSRDAVVTGAAGWLGQNLVRTLAGRRARVRCLVRTPAEAASLEVLSPVIEPVVGDVRDPIAIDRLFEGMSPVSVFHTAAIIHPEARTREVFDVNVGGTALLVDQAKRAGAVRFLHVSSNSPFGLNPYVEHRFTETSPYDPYLSYGQSKMEAELLVKRAQEAGDMTTVILRAPWFYGPYQPARQTRFLAAVRKGRFPIVGDGRNRRSMVYTDDLVQGLLLAESVEAAAGRAYWIADAEAYEMRAIVEGVRAAARAEGLHVVDFQPRLPRVAGAVAARLDHLAQANGRYVQSLHVLGELGATIACDISASRNELGYEPSVGLVEGMRRSIRWCAENGQAV